jgi:hypothetical protein
LRKKDREKCYYDPNRLFNRFMLHLLPRSLSSIDAERCSLFFLSCSVFLIFDFLCLFVIYDCESLNHCFLRKIYNILNPLSIKSCKINNYFQKSLDVAPSFINTYISGFHKNFATEDKHTKMISTTINSSPSPCHRSYDSSPNKISSLKYK